MSSSHSKHTNFLKPSRHHPNDGLVHSDHEEESLDNNKAHPPPKE